MERILTTKEKEDLKAVLDSDKDVSVLMFGRGGNRTISFYQEGTRLEARIPYPDLRET